MATIETIGVGVSANDGTGDTLRDGFVKVNSNFAALNTGTVVTAFSQKSGTYTITNTDHSIEVTANTFTITLPTAISQSGRVFIVKNSGTGVVTLDGNGTETIDGGLTATLNQYDSITVQSNGSNWIII